MITADDIARIRRDLPKGSHGARFLEGLAKNLRTAELAAGMVCADEPLEEALKRDPQFWQHAGLAG